jgi:glycosyltransferase involved in cell wall biosynthesis
MTQLRAAALAYSRRIPVERLVSKPDNWVFSGKSGARRIPAAVATPPKVAILLCTYHGQEYLAEQLESFMAQTHESWQVFASDDGSQDGTPAILGTYQRQWGGEKLTVFQGPGDGFAANFLSLVHRLDIEADYYAYSDQDDIWEKDKLQRAVAWLSSVPESVPALYCSRTRIVDAENIDIGISPLFSKPPSFANALIQNVGGGNTMAFNNAARELLLVASSNLNVVSHDWWTYMVVSGCGGRVFYDPQPSLRYRQHDGNMVGVNSCWPARLIRVRMLLEGRFKTWNDSNIQALIRLEQRLTPENRKTFQRFVQARNKSLLPRLLGLKRSGIYRQTILGNIGLVAAALLGKI